jgi:cytidyltransferase-like protein
MTYCFDLDNTLCQTNGRDYATSQPIFSRIYKVNSLYEQGHYILIYTARGMGFYKGDLSKIESEYREMTESALRSWGLKFHKLQFGKPSYDRIIDDKNMSLLEFDSMTRIKGFVAGAFDLIHPGYALMFEEAKRNCSHLTVALHINPSKERPGKLSPILNRDERICILRSIRYIDDVVTYQTEEDLKKILDFINPDVRFLGEDYQNQDYTQGNSRPKIHYLNRSHGWSTTRLKKLIHKQIQENG